MKHIAISIQVLLLLSIKNCSLLSWQQKNSSKRQRRILTTAGDALKDQIEGKNRIRLGIFQANRQTENGFYQKWEGKEKGSIQSAIDAFQTLFIEIYQPEKQQMISLYQAPLTFEVLSIIRKNFSQQQGGNYTLHSSKGQETEIYHDYVYFGINRSNEVQRKNAKDYIVESQNRIQIAIKFYEQKLQQDILNNQTDQNVQDETVQQKQEELIKVQEIQILNLEPYSLYEEENEKTQKIDYFIKSNENAKPEIKLLWIKSLLQLYENEVQELQLDQNLDAEIDINSQDQKVQQFLEKLATLITDLERIHPYLDFNCRTFAVFMLNKELIRYNMMPSIMEDPNDFDFYTIQDSVEKIKEGQQNFINLIQNGKMHQTDPDDSGMLQGLTQPYGLSRLFCKNQKNPQTKYYISFPINSLFSLKEESNNIQDIDKFKAKIVNMIKFQKPFQLIIQTLKDQPVKIIDEDEQKSNGTDQQQYITIDELVEKQILKTFECKTGFEKITDLQEIKQRADYIFEVNSKRDEFKQMYPEYNVEQNLKDKEIILI